MFIDRPKIFGIGFHKTGTKTLGAALNALGFSVCSWGWDHFKLWAKGGPEAMSSVVNEYNAFEDFPWPFCYAHFDRTVPNAKFILTTRLSSDTWFASLLAHSEKTGPKGQAVRKRVYGHEMPHGAPDRHVEVYLRHNEAVRHYFAGHNNFLEVCWERGDGWEKLAGFIGCPIPSDPFPHLNSSKTTLT